MSSGVRVRWYAPALVCVCVFVRVCTYAMNSRKSTRSVPRYGIGSRLPVVCLRRFEPRKRYFHGTSGKQRTSRQLVRKCPTSSPLARSESFRGLGRVCRPRLLAGTFVCARAIWKSTSEIFIRGVYPDAEQTGRRLSNLRIL